MAKSYLYAILCVLVYPHCLTFFSHIIRMLHYLRRLQKERKNKTLNRVNKKKSLCVVFIVDIMLTEYEALIAVATLLST